jgi:hypothetical protein
MRICREIACHFESKLSYFAPLGAVRLLYKTEIRKGGDGPSAGVAMFMSMTSLVTERTPGGRYSTCAASSEGRNANRNRRFPLEGRLPDTITADQ